MEKALTKKKKTFVEEYLKDYNGTAAAIRAGYSEKSAAQQASRLLREPEVLAYRDELITAEVKAIGVSKESLLRKSEQLYRKCVDADDSRGAAKALELQGKLIGAFSEKREIEGSGFEILLTEKEDTDANA